MRIDIISVVPELLESPLNFSIVKRAKDKGLVDIIIHNLRDFSSNKYRQVDDYQYGGGSGMVLMVEPLDKCISKLKNERNYDEIIYMTPDAKTLNQDISNELSLCENIIIVCGHYKGIDQRIRELHVTREVSIGDFVLSGGELPACVLVDSLVRLMPGVLGDSTSALTDSFQNNLLSSPIYTRPAEYKDMEVPKVLLSGDFPKIEKFREEKALERTRKIRPDLLSKN